MSLKKFGQSDVIRNAMRAFPHNTFFIYDSSVYYDNRPIESGSFSNDILSASGGLSLYEYNVDRQGELSWSDRGDEDSWTDSAGTNRLITPYVLKSSSKQYLKSKRRTRTIVEGPAGTNTIIASGPMQEVSDDYVKAANTDVLTGSSYVMSASITRELMVDAGNLGSITNVSRSANPHYRSLRNSLNFYGTRSPHYFVEFSASNIGQWNKDEQTINLISVPKIFYGTRIKPGSLSLKFYVTGTLVGELQDTKYNGELIQIGPEGSTGSGSVAGVAMYEEGFVLLTGSWDLSTETMNLSGTTSQNPQWIYYAAGANDGFQSTDTSASFGFSFKGHTETQVLTMYAHARRGEVNFSNNPTFLDYEDAQYKIYQTSSNVYQEKDTIKIKNTVSSSYAGFDAPFERQVYVSRVAIYDDDKKLVGVATLSNPILKKEAQDLSFKLKLDI
jgi:hypothetical protein